MGRKVGRRRRGGGQRRREKKEDMSLGAIFSFGKKFLGTQKIKQ